MAKEIIHTAPMSEFLSTPKKVSAKRLVRAGTNLAFGYALIPFVKIKSLSKGGSLYKKSNGNNSNSSNGNGGNR